MAENLKEDKDVRELYSLTEDNMLLTRVVFKDDEGVNIFVRKLEK